MKALGKAFRRLAAARDGAAVVEFALILPVMLLLYLGTIEASALISMDRRVQTVTGTIGDLVARVDGVVSATALRDYFRAAENIIAPYSTATLVQTVSLVYVDEDGETQIRWSRQFEAGQADHAAGHPVGSAYELPAEITSLAEDAFVVVSESSYSYTPLLGLVFQSDFPLYRENFYIPRFGEPICYNAC
ncbi:hypothetical protein VE25_03540 [Devosia geojensis]|uniref:TadE-like domain-containing protein n=1 Tax=Devosia geojensis TaxID=443610 RepID=A0A0F5FX90_9HYPH|nr:TadE/TadG family type IV pilus assembly protein [Devosia geojensis]KKB13165.1 hypothetical protein VE25_03540 [Devosia geojensis]